MALSSSVRQTSSRLTGTSKSTPRCSRALHPSRSATRWLSRSRSPKNAVLDRRWICSSRHRLSDRVVPGVAGLYVTGYAAMVVVYVVFMFVPGRIGTTERERLLGSQLQRWPSLTLADELSTARRFAITLANEEPDTLLVTARGAWFYWDPAVDRSRLRELSCDALRASSVSGPSRLVIVSFDKGAPEDLWYYDGNAESGRFFRADCFERLPHREIRQRFPEEGIKVLEARVDAGQQVILRP